MSKQVQKQALPNSGIYAAGGGRRLSVDGVLENFKKGRRSAQEAYEFIKEAEQNEEDAIVEALDQL